VLWKGRTYTDNEVIIVLIRVILPAYRRNQNIYFLNVNNVITFYFSNYGVIFSA